MTDNITVIGVVGGDPRVHVTNQGLPITSFRLASTRRFFDRAKGTWENGDTNWYTVSTFRQLAKNAAVSIRRGDRVVVHGRLRLRAWESGEKNGTAIEIDADSLGHDLSWGTTSLTRNHAAASTEPLTDAAAGSAAADDDFPAGWATPLGVGADDPVAFPRAEAFGEAEESTVGGAHLADPDDEASDEDVEAGRDATHVAF
jgi:single-strand DNA-binding protein